MRYALNLAEDGRILSVSYYNEHTPKDAVLVDEKPEGNVSDYRYVDGKYIYDPLPEPEPPAAEPSYEERIEELEEALAMLLSGVVE